MSVNEMGQREQTWLELAVESLKDVAISGHQAPTYYNVPLVEFVKDDLIRLIMQLRERSEKFEHELVRQTLRSNQ